MTRAQWLATEQDILDHPERYEKLLRRRARKRSNAEILIGGRHFLDINR
jgi:hypothetical protein